MLSRACFRAFVPALRLGRTRRSAVRDVAMASLLLAGVPAHASANVPDWVRDAAHQATPSGLAATTKAVVLLSDTTYSVSPDGRATEHVREVIRILRPQGRELAVPVVWYDKDSKISTFRVWSIDPAGHEYTLKDTEVADIGMPGEGGELYGDDRARVAAPPGLDPGGVVAYEYERRMRPYVAETNWFFQGQLPRLNQRFRLVLPAAFTYTTTWAHHPRVEGADLENHSYVWEMNNEAAIDLEHVPLSPSEGALAARMTVHYSGPGLAQPQEGTWKGIGEWYSGLVRDRLAASPEIIAKAAELTAGKTDFYDKAEAIAEFLQQHIRYYAIEIGIGGYQPHFAADIFRGGYGDCKDKATLLTSMLGAVGIHSALVMVDSHRGTIDPEDPSTVANHVIAAIEIPAGYQSPKLHSVVTAGNGKRFLIFDPTAEKTPFGQLENALQGGYGVLAEGPESQIVRLPVLAPELNTVSRSARFTLAADGTLRGAVTERRFGGLAESRRALALRVDSRHQQEFMDRAVGSDFASVALTGLKFADAGTLSKDVTTSYSVDAPHFATSVGPLLMIRPRVLGRYGFETDHNARKVPVDLEQAMQGTDEFDIEIPAGYAVDELPQPVKLDWGFAAYESRTEAIGSRLHYKRTFTVRDVTLPAARYHDLEDVVSTIAADEDGRAILKRTPQAAVPAAVSNTVTASNPAR